MALLDALRGVSAQLVMFGHVMYANGVPTARYWPDLGVVCFLVISGFLVTRSAMQKPAGYRFADFMLDRGARIYAAYLPALATIVLAGLMLPLPGPIDAIHLLSNLLLLQNFPLPAALRDNGMLEPIGTGRPLWTLAVEWWFYWAFAALYFLPRARNRWLLLLVALPGFVMVAAQSASWILAYPWFIGSLGAFYAATTPRLAAGHIAAIAGTSTLCVTRYVHHTDFYDLQGVLLASATIVGSILAARAASVPKAAARSAHFLASYSFSLYLLNATVVAIMTWAGLVSIPLMIVACHTVALGNYLLAERHHRRLALLLRQVFRGPCPFAVEADPPPARSNRDAR